MVVIKPCINYAWRHTCLFTTKHSSVPCCRGGWGGRGDMGSHTSTLYMTRVAPLRSSSIMVRVSHLLKCVISRWGPPVDSVWQHQMKCKLRTASVRWWSGLVSSPEPCLTSWPGPRSGPVYNIGYGWFTRRSFYRGSRGNQRQGSLTLHVRMLVLQLKRFWVASQTSATVQPAPHSTRCPLIPTCSLKTHIWMNCRSLYF